MSDQDRTSPQVPIGHVVQVSLATGPTLAVILAVFNAGQVLGIGMNQEVAWIPADSVTDWQPRCSSCGGHAWWWTPAAVSCATCAPPVPDWEQGFIELHEMLDRLPPEVRTLPAVLQHYAAADAAWLANDWPRFQRAAVVIRSLALFLPHLVAMKVQQS